MLNVYALECSCARGTGPKPSGKDPERNWAERRSRSLLSFLILCVASATVGCGETSQQAVEDQKQKQLVNQEKMKAYMMEKKAQSRGARR
jgi:hypothetical protein